jgi:hypothetical protein
MKVHPQRPRRGTNRQVAGQRRQTGLRPRGSRDKSQRRIVRIVKKPLVWAIGIVILAAGTILSQVLIAIPGQIVDSQKLKDELRTGNDLSASVRVVNDDGWYMIATPEEYRLAPDDPLRRQVGGSDRVDELADRLRSSEGFAAPYLRVQIVLESRRNQTIQLTNLSLIDIRLGTPAAGTLLWIPPQGGVAPNVQVGYDLAEAVPIAHSVREDGTLWDPYFQLNTIRLQDRDQVVLKAQFSARPRTSEQFKLQLEYTISGESKTLTVDDRGHLFRVSDVNCLKSGTASYLSYDRAYLLGNDETNLLLIDAEDPRHIPSENLEAPRPLCGS